MGCSLQGMGWVSDENWLWVMGWAVDCMTSSTTEWALAHPLIERCVRDHHGTG